MTVPIKSKPVMIGFGVLVFSGFSLYGYFSKRNPLHRRLPGSL